MAVRVARVAGLGQQRDSYAGRGIGSHWSPQPSPNQVVVMRQGACQRGGAGIPGFLHLIVLLRHPSREDISQAHRILCVSERHVKWILSAVPGAAGKTSTLAQDIPDPWHQEQAAYDRVAQTMLDVVPESCDEHFGHLFKHKS